VGSTRRGSAPALLLAVLALAGLVALGYFGDSPTVAVALLATVPLFAAIFLGPLGTTFVAVLSVVAALVVMWLKSDGDITGYVLPLIGVGVASVVALGSSAIKGRQVAAQSAAASASAAGPQASQDIDAMTGLLNRGGAIRALGSRNLGDPRVISFIDCDAFHLVNEGHGRDVGDEFLQAIAGRLRHSLPARDTVARWGDDEFLIVLTTDPKAAVPALERVVGSINGHPIRTAAGSIESTMSAGAAAWEPGQELEDVIARAARALGVAKNSGPGRVVLDPGAGPAGHDGRPEASNSTMPS